MTWRLACAVVVLFAGLGVESAQRSRPRFKLLPQDEAAQVPAFKAYRDALQAAVAAREADRVLAMIHTEIREVFYHTLRLRRDQIAGGVEHQDWTKLEELLRLGGTFTKGPNRVRGSGQRRHATREFCAPYVWSAYPQPVRSELEEQSQAYPWVVLGSNVAVRAHPPRDMRVLMRLDYDLVHPFSTSDVHAGAPHDWIGILTPDGRRGYVAARFIRSRSDYHACFGEFDGTWLMTVFRRGGGP